MGERCVRTPRRCPASGRLHPPATVSGGLLGRGLRCGPPPDPPALAPVPWGALSCAAPLPSALPSKAGPAVADDRRRRCHLSSPRVCSSPDDGNQFRLSAEKTFSFVLLGRAARLVVESSVVAPVGALVCWFRKGGVSDVCPRGSRARQGDALLVYCLTFAAVLDCSRRTGTRAHDAFRLGVEILNALPRCVFSGGVLDVWPGWRRRLRSSYGSRPVYHARRRSRV